MKVLLINPVGVNKFRGAFALPPNGLLSIAAVLEKAGHSVQISDGNIDDRQTKDFMSFDPAVVGFSVLTGPNIDDAIKQSIEFKKLKPSIKVVWGNVHPSVTPEQTIQEDCIDFVVVGAGEFTLLELINRLEETNTDFANIQGLVYKIEGKIFINQPRAFIKDLDDLPDPAWHLIDIHKYRTKTLNTSRGCPFRCSFCYNFGFYHGYRGDFSPERIVNQIHKLKKIYRVKSVRLLEDNFTANRKRLRDFCHLLVEKKIKIKWDCEARADLEEKDIGLMARCGCTSLGLGIETGSPRLLSFLKKEIDLAQVEKTYWLLIKNRIMPSLYIMEALPTETVEDLLLTRSLLERLDNPPYMYRRFVPSPGTALFDYCVTEKLIDPPKRLRDWSGFTLSAFTTMNLSNIPLRIIDEAMDLYGKNYAKDRIRFIFRHNLPYLWKIVVDPKEFFFNLKSLVDCSRFYSKMKLSRAPGT